MVLVVSMSKGKSLASKAAFKRPTLPAGSFNSKRTAATVSSTDMGGGPLAAWAGRGRVASASSSTVVVLKKARRVESEGARATSVSSLSSSIASGLVEASLVVA